MSANVTAQGTTPVAAEGTPIVAPEAAPVVTQEAAAPVTEPVVEPQPVEAPKTQEQIDTDIATAEKRLVDKEAYLEVCKGKLSNYDRDIEDQRKQLREAKAAAPVVQPQTTPLEPSPAATNAPTSDKMTPGEFIGAMNSGDDATIAAAMKRFQDESTQNAVMMAEDKVVQRMHEEQFKQRYVEEYEGIQAELGPELSQLFEDAVTEHNQRGERRPLQDIATDVMYGTREQQLQLLELGKATLGVGQQPAPVVQEHRPIAPGNGMNLTPRPAQGASNANTAQAKMRAALRTSGLG